jgi:hypothetical protein
MTDLPQPPLERYKKDAISCTLVNQTSGALQYNRSSKTGGDLSIKQITLNPGESAVAFIANGPGGLPSGCGGQVIYNLPNGEDQVVLVYNVDVNAQSAQIFAELQNQTKTRAGCDSYFVVVVGGSVIGTSLSPTLTIYEAGSQGSTTDDDDVTYNGVQITVNNQLDTWITLNNFPNPKWEEQAVASNGTTSIAPGTSAIVLSAKDSQQMTLIYNIDADTLLTIQQQKSDYPTAGFNVSSPYKAAVTWEPPNKFYTVTIMPD